MTYLLSTTNLNNLLYLPKHHAGTVENNSPFQNKKTLKNLAEKQIHLNFFLENLFHQFHHLSNQFTRKYVVVLLGMLIGIVIALPCVAAGNEFSCSKQVKLNLSYFKASIKFTISLNKS